MGKLGGIRRIGLIPIIGMLLVMSVGTALATNEYRSDQRTSKDREAERLTRIAEQASENIKSAFDSYASVMASTQGLFFDSTMPGQEKWRAFVTNATPFTNLVAANNLTFIAPAESDEVSSLQATVRKQDKGFTARPASDQGDHYFTIYSGPGVSRPDAIGTDIATVPELRDVLTRSATTGAAQVSQPYFLLRDRDLPSENQRPGVAIAVPLYRGTAIPASAEERQEQLWGWAAAGFRLDTFLDEVNKESNQPVAIDMFDAESTESIGRTASDGVGEPVVQNVAFGGRTFRIETKELLRPASAPNPANDNARTELAFGIALTLVTALLIGMLLRRYTSEQQRARATENKLELSQRRSTALVELASDAIVIVDPRGRAMWSSPSTSAVFSEEFASGKRKIFDFVHDEDCDAVRETFEELLSASGESRIVAFRIVDSNGLTWVEAAVRNLIDEPAVNGFVLNIRDVTERHQALDAVNETLDHRKELDAVKSDFLATISHDFRSPLTSIVGFGSLLEEEWDHFNDDKRRDMVHRIVIGGEELSRRVTDFLQISQLEQIEIHLDKSPVSLRQSIERVLSRIGFLVQDHRFAIDIEDDLTLVADQQALERILENLFTNACKYSPAGTTVGVRAARRNRNVSISVSDEGVGIAGDDSQRIFERFYRGRTGRTRPGSGVGLTTVRLLTEAMNGSVELTQSQVGVGSTFTVTLPVDRQLVSR